jgi:hypothetical protein
VDPVAFPWEKLGVVMLLGLGLIGAYREWWFSGTTVRRMMADKDAVIADKNEDIAKLERRLDRAVALLGRAVDVADKEK